MSETVECRSDASYAERPRAFTWQGQRLEVVDILKSWRSPEGIGFRVSIKDGRLFELLYNQALDEWVVGEL
jgi:hypothetical protein